MKLINYLLNKKIQVILFLVIVSVPAIYFYAHIQFEEGIEIWFEKNDPDIEYYREFRRKFGNEEMVVIVNPNENIFSNESFTFYRNLTDKLEELPFVQRVTSISNTDRIKATEEVYDGRREKIISIRKMLKDRQYTEDEIEKLKKDISKNPLYVRKIISPDERAAIITIELEPVTLKQKKVVIHKIRQTVKQIAPDRLFYFGGAPVTETEFTTISQSDQKFFIPITVILIFFILLIMLRNFFLSVIILVLIEMVTSWTLGLYVALGFNMNIVAIIIVPVLLSIIVANSIHVIIHYFEERMNHPPDSDSRKILLDALRYVARPCFFTAATTCIGFLSFLTSPVKPVKVLGVFIAIGVSLAFSVIIVVIPVLLYSFPALGRRHITFAPSSVSLPPFLNRIIESVNKFFSMKAMLESIHSFTVRFHRYIVLASVFILAFAIIGITRIQIETDLTKYLPGDHWLVGNINKITDIMGGITPVVTIIKAKDEKDDFSNPHALRKLEEADKKILSNVKDFTDSNSINLYLKEMNRAFNDGNYVFFAIPDKRVDVKDYLELINGKTRRQYISSDYKEAKLMFYQRQVPATVSRKNRDHYMKILGEILGDRWEFRATGTGPLYNAMESNLMTSQIKSFSVAFVLISIMMFIITRSLRLGIISMLPNILPILLTGGIMGWFGIYLDVATVMIGAIAMGIVVDDTIHFVTRFSYEFSKGLDPSVAIQNTLNVAGRPIVITSIILISGFLVLVTGSAVPIVNFGLISSISIFLALLGDLFILPAIIMLWKPKL